ncbi:MAG: polysaccharide biosynthesis/export family protein [Pseudomonadota bacterium]
MKYFLTALIGLMMMSLSAVAQSDYRLKPGDTITVEVLEDNQLNRSLLVLPDGSISFPFAGEIRAGGRTISEVRSAIAQGISSNFANTPTVFVTVSQLRPRVAATGPAAPVTITIYFTGEVGAPGPKQVAPGTTFLQAVAQSGGFTKFAATKRVQLRRTDATGAQTIYEIDYRALSRGAKLANAIFMQDGDVILVPERRLFE